MIRQKILMDSDPGHDDAIALLLASFSEKVELIGVTTCFFNCLITRTSSDSD